MNANTNFSDQSVRQNNIDFTTRFKGARENVNSFLIQNRGKGPPGRKECPEGHLLPLSDINSAAFKSCTNNLSTINKLPNTNFQINFTIKK